MKKRTWIVVTAVAAVLVWGGVELGKDKADKGAQDSVPSSVASATSSSSASGSASGSMPSSSPSDSAASETAAPPSASATSSSGDEPQDGGQASEEAPSALEALMRSNAPSSTIEKDEDGLAVITNPDSLLVLVNKKRNLPADYEPDDLVVPEVAFSFSGDSPKKQMRKPAAEALKQLFDAAKDDGIDLKAVSGYRSYDRQKALFASYAAAHGEEEANTFSAHPGQSEHQTGLAMDVSSDSVKYGLEASYGETKEGKWLAAHAHEYGFIIRYPEGQEAITGYTYEPWHVRYIGVDAATAVYDSKLTLEQFMEQYDGPVKA